MTDSSVRRTVDDLAVAIKHRSDFIRKKKLETIIKRSRTRLNLM